MITQGTQKVVVINCHNVADFFLAFSNETGEVITNLKLQKLVYYAQAWYLANYKKPLFDEEFQAWIHGPVIPALYNTYKERGSMPIVKDLKFADIYGLIDGGTFGFLQEVAKIYMPYGAYELEMMTHQEDPWIEARGGCASDERCENVIQKSSMQEYYGQKTTDKTQ